MENESISVMYGRNARSLALRNALKELDTAREAFMTFEKDNLPLWKVEYAAKDFDKASEILEHLLEIE